MFNLNQNNQHFFLHETILVNDQVCLYVYLVSINTNVILETNKSCLNLCKMCPLLLMINLLPQYYEVNNYSPINCFHVKLLNFHFQFNS